MNLKKVNSVYFIGIGGIGMSALAHYFLADGKQVGGYDKTSSLITKSLEESGAIMHYDDELTSIPEQFKYRETLIVFTPAIPESHKGLTYFRDNQYELYKRSEVLGMITKNTFCFAVAGTHGKTTTSSILGHLLKVCDADMTAFLGGITENYHSNLIQNGNKISVVEADEFDRSFLKLSPDVACITSMDADHLDIYGEAEALQDSFNEFANKLENRQKLFVRKGLPINGITYGINEAADYAIEDVRIEEGSYLFSIKTPKETLKDIVFHFPGEHNLLNALAAFAMAYDSGYNHQNLIKGLDSFKGVERRFTYQIKTKDFVFIDDYAHHPTEIRAIHQAVREMHPNKKVIALFQPHLFSRTQDFIEEFAASLSDFDTVRLLEIYPARELPIEGVDSNWLLGKIKNKDKKLISKQEMVAEILASKATIILTIGAGDIGLEVPKIKEKLMYEMELG
ncbi:MAG: UDP-N-acetylmuramate--L-alanine ligase [Flavobacteriaceae bacterium]|nr:UDP-N-acetylmuramate--L-alanine ligase [Flavobacteriaceae bacterium]